MTPALRLRRFQFSLRSMLLWHVPCAALLAYIATIPNPPLPPYDPYDPLRLNLHFGYPIAVATLLVTKIIGAGLLIVTWLFAPWLTRTMASLFRRWRARPAAH
jgi:hypothetical protein